MDCMEKARKGCNSSEVWLFDFLCEPELLRTELDMMGLIVHELRLDSDKALNIKITWPLSPVGNLFHPSGLTSGNFSGECKVCFSSARMCRLHPCGHLIGYCCASRLMNKSCPFCREIVRIAHALFEP